MAELFMLDTNTVSALLRRDPQFLGIFETTPMDRLCLSAVTAGELAYGVAKRPDATRLAHAVERLLAIIDVHPWTRETAMQYGKLRHRLESRGSPMGSLDTMIAAHALSIGATIVSRDQAFHRNGDFVPVVDWSSDPSG